MLNSATFALFALVGTLTLALLTVAGSDRYHRRALAAAEREVRRLRREASIAAYAAYADSLLRGE